jgi:aminopeptidase N
MPLNDHPSAKPTYDFYDTVNAGNTAIANGTLQSTVHNPPDAQFPGGSTTWQWHSPAPIASYLVENSVGNYDLTWRDASDGIRYYEAQRSSIDAAQQQANLAIMDQQQDITDFQSQFNGPFPFTSDGVLVGIPEAGFEEEMQTMITFQGGQIDLDTFHHENMHQWWGDNVTEANYNLTFFKEGMATLGEYLFDARNAAKRRGWPGHAGGRRGVRCEPGRSVQHELREQAAPDRGTLRPDAGHAVLEQLHLHPPRHGVHRAAADPGQGELHQRDAADPARLPVLQHHREAAGGRVPRVDAESECGVQRASGPVLRPVVRHRVPARRRREPAAADRPRSRWPRLLQR